MKCLTLLCLAQLRLVDTDLHLHIENGQDNKADPETVQDGESAIAHQNQAHALRTRRSQFVFLSTLVKDVFIIRAADSHLCLHAHGGSQSGARICLHEDEAYARKVNNPNSRFRVVRIGTGFALKVEDKNLCIHAHGGSNEGAKFVLHEGVEYARTHENSQFVFVPI